MEPGSSRNGDVPGLQETEAYWKGVVALSTSEEDATWGTALVWLRDGRVSRVLVNLRADDVGVLIKALEKSYGSATSTDGTRTRWTLPGSVEAVLDVGGAASLVVGSSTTDDKAQPH